MRLVSSLSLKFVALCGILLGGNTSLAQLPCGYNVTEVITTPPCGIFQSAPTVGAISPNGELVVGTYSCVGGDERGFIYRTASNQFLTMPMPQGISSLWAFDVNDDGKVAGTMGGTTGEFGYIYDLNNGQYVTQIPPVVSGGQSAITGINSSGWACGYRTISKPILDNINAAFVVSPQGQVTDLGVMNGPRSAATDITENNIVVGWTGHGLLITDTRGFLWQNGQVTVMGAIPGGLSSAARSANDIPQVLLWGHLDPQPATRTRTFLWEAGRMTDIGVLPGFDSTSGRCINASSVVIGSCTNLGQGGVRYAWYAGIMHPLNGLVDDNAGLTQLGATRINDRGQIVGPANLGTDNVGFVLNPVPRAPGDTNCDQVVNIIDVLEVIGTWGRCQGCVTDFTGDETVNISDLLFVIQNWTVF